MRLMTSMLLVLAILSPFVHPFVRRYGAKSLAFVAFLPLAAFVILIAQAPAVFTGTTYVEHLTWIPQLDMTLTFRLDVVGLLFALLVTGAGALILFYSSRYFSSKEVGLPRFSAAFMGFFVSMLGLVLSDDVYMLFVFWEATTVFSFLLIGHAARLRTAQAAALQALMVTVFGGLAMLVGLVILSIETGTSRLSEIVANPPDGTAATVAVMLLLVGALSKSAIFPFHFWLPGAMAAPTPVSAYLHAAAMVKAGIYLVARISPGFADTPGFREVLVILGAITMIVGGVRALRQFDIKLIVAHGTVSQLGFIIMIFGIGDPRTDVAGFALLFAHALAKAPLFLAVGIIDHSAGTRDLRKLSGVARQMRVLTVITTLAAASMAGLPFFGFVAKEATLTELVAIGAEQPLASLAFWVTIIGSILTFAYMARFLWGAFAVKSSVHSCTLVQKRDPWILVAPAVFVALTIIAGAGAAVIDPWLQQTVTPVEGQEPGHLALWHGFTPILAISVGIFIVGALLFLLLRRTTPYFPPTPERLSAAHAYWLLTHWIDTFSIRLTALTQRGSLPFYLAVILGVFVVALGGTAIATGSFPERVEFMSSPVQIPVALVMIIAAIFVLRAPTRFQAVVLVGVTGYGMATIFALHGAPDLAITQALVETVTMIAFVLVIRRLPQRIGSDPLFRSKWIRIIIGSAVGLVMALLAVFFLGSRVAEQISLKHPELAVLGGHGKNVVNVMLVDIRAWDTMGELSVVLAAATGVASLVFVRTRIDTTPKLSRKAARTQAREHLMRIADPNDATERYTWLLAGRHLEPGRRSIIIEVVVRLIFHALILLSIYLLLTGHNTPGGGFAGGLVAGLALAARYLAGGRQELGATVPLDAGRILGTGLAIAVGMAIVPLLFGQSALASSWFDLDLGVFGEISFVTSTIFDIGVYLVVFGLMLDVLRSLGGEIDEHEEEESDDALMEEVGNR